jgi:hypothetical protein
LVIAQNFSEAGNLIRGTREVFVEEGKFPEFVLRKLKMKS